jgi:hypothetical protein
MAKGDMQTNRRLGEASIALYFGRKPQWLPPADATMISPVSPNQFDEACAVALAANLPGAEQQATARLEWQRDRGHCCKGRKSETLSDSHAPIEYRAQAIGLWAARKRGGKVQRLYEQWWAHEIWLCQRTIVKDGPLEGSIVALGGRWQDGWDETRDICQALIAGHGHNKSNNYFVRAATRQDTFASLVIRDLLHDGAFDNVMAEKPFLPFSYTILRYSNGHKCKSVEGWSNQPDDPSTAWVKYDQGKIGVGESPDLGRLVETIEVSEVCNVPR